MSETIDSISKKFKTITEYQHFCTAQQKLITDLQNELQITKEKTTQLEKLLGTNSYLLKDSSEVNKLLSESSDAETIALAQLKLLNIVSATRELTLEEAKKVELYYKVLSSIQNKNKEKNDKTKNLDNQDLLELIDVNQK